MTNEEAGFLAEATAERDFNALDKKQKGLYGKFHVNRADGQDYPGGVFCLSVGLYEATIVIPRSLLFWSPTTVSEASCDLPR